MEKAKSHYGVIKGACLLTALIITTWVHQGYTQLVINPQLPAIGLTLKSQLWNISVINTTNQEFQAQLQVQLINVSNNQKVLTGTTRFIFFPRGLKQLNANEVAPVIYNAFDAASGVNNSPDGFLPVGSYDVCYTLMKKENDYLERIAEECQSVQIEPISPPQLAYPANNDAIEKDRPLFTWLPPAPINLFTGLTYNYTLVEVLTTQSPADAIQQNIPLASAQNINPNTYLYPQSLQPLDTGRLYAWRISARSGGNNITNSDVWTFTVKKNSDIGKASPSAYQYIKLRRDQSGSPAICRGILHYEYLHAYKDQIAHMRLLDITSANRIEMPLDSALVQVRYGQNLKQIDFGKRFLIDQHLYLLELVNARNEHWFLKMQFLKP